MLGGCENKSHSTASPHILSSFGRTGKGPGEFMYPRAIAMDSNQGLYIVDKAGRVQHFDLQGRFLNGFVLPDIKAGKPTGVTVGPHGNLYIADTHYHRILVMSPSGDIVNQWGRYGETDGCFIYPTDVAFDADGRLFVSEYGGNDRISVFDSQGAFLYDFGNPDSGPLVLSRPAALCTDTETEELYIADACHHRIVVVDYKGKVRRIVGTLGREPGQLRYPYDMALLPDKRLVVCEYGNNRIQVFNREGRSLALYGRAGRELGQLAYPWGISVDQRRCAYIVDAGNNRIQLWQL